jgi:NAD(P)-dependent dehydrogenase (short-subunit alcohol dehydrogenase family)
VLRAAALKGNGITLLPTFMVGPDIKAGRLQVVLPDNLHPSSASTPYTPPTGTWPPRRACSSISWSRAFGETPIVGRFSRCPLTAARRQQRACARRSGGIVGRGVGCRRISAISAITYGDASMAGQGKVAVVTGGGSGSGARRRWRCRATAGTWSSPDAARKELDKTVAMAKSGGGKMLAVRTDVTKPEDVKALFAETQKAFGGASTSCSTTRASGAGRAHGRAALRKWKSVVDVILHGSFLCAQEAIRIMKSQNPKGGRIVNNGSISAYTPRPNSVAYTSSKHAITGLTKCIALDGRQHDIACGQLDVGNADTAMGGRMKAACHRPTARSRRSRCSILSTPDRRSATWRACRSTPTCCS